MMRSEVGKTIPWLFVLMLGFSVTSFAQNPPVPNPPNRVLGQVEFSGKTKPEKTAGVWIDGQYVGYVDELVGDKKVLLLPGDHEISIRQPGYLNLTQTITVEAEKQTTVTVALERDPQARYPAVTAEIKLKVTPERAAVFVDDAFVGTVHEFDGVGRGMLVSPGKHRVKIALVGYQPFETDVNLRENQKIKIKADLVSGNPDQAGPEIKKP
jgi:hypothetical protein